MEHGPIGDTAKNLDLVVTYDKQMGLTGWPQLINPYLNYPQ
jgi:hypothetical protein